MFGVLGGARTPNMNHDTLLPFQRLDIYTAAKQYLLAGRCT
jgi:hypothetical protein